MEIHAPAVIDLLHQLNETGCCEFLCEPYSHGLSSLANEDCFREEVLRQRDKMKQMFGKEPKVFRNSSLIYSDEIGGLVASMGFKGMLTEGAKHVLGWKSPHYVYHCNQAQVLSSCCGISNSLTTSVCAFLIRSGRNIRCLLISILIGSMHCRKKSKLLISLWN